MANTGTFRQVAIADRFLDAFSALPKKAQTQVRAQLEILRENPAHPSLNYETIKNAGDPRMRSVRINSDYRLIVAHPNGNGTYLVLWVDKHDAAYDWAMRHRLDPGDERDGLIILSIPDREMPDATNKRPPLTTGVATKNALADCTDDQLIEVGVSTALLPALRACQSDEALLDALKSLRAEVAEDVMCLALGEPLINRLQETDSTDQEAMGISVTAETGPDADPVEVALRRPESSRRFVVLSSQQELEQALDYPLERWRLFLHPDQRSIVTRHFSGPALVSGGAGTGKTVVGLHRARFLAMEVFTEPEDRILVTTFTRNLALNLKDLIDSLCGNDGEVRERIVVSHMHSLAIQLAVSAGLRFGIVTDDDATRLMSEAVQNHDQLGLPVSFYLAEWNEVIQEREALTHEAYLQVDRSGRGRALNRAQRAAIWPVLDAFRAALSEAKRADWPTVLRVVRERIEDGTLSLPYRFRAAIVDEAQDLGAPEMRLLLTLVGQRPDSLLLLGDTRQQIYARGSYVRTLGIPIGRRHVSLRVNYRTTEQIREAAARVVASASTLSGEPLRKDNSISLLSGPPPTIRPFATDAEEQQAVIEAIREALDATAAEEIALVGRSKSTVTRYHAALQASGIPSEKLEGNTTRGNGVHVGTMHRVKGLEFRAVYIVDCSAGSVPATYKGEDDAAARADHEERERRLLYVAMTRARELLWISGSEQLSPFLESQANMPD